MENRLEQDKISIKQRKQLKSAVSTKNFSILPDLATGWRPKVLKIHPPILIKYKQPFINNLITNLHQNSQNKINQQSSQSYQPLKSSKIVYLGPRHYNSFSFHNKVPHDYHMRFAVKNQQLPQNFQAQIQKYKKLQNRPFIGMNPNYNNIVQNINKQNYSIKFQSNFQSGNLDLVIETGKNQYDLFLRPDTNTCGHTQWFYFKVNVKKQLNNSNNLNNLNNSYSQKQPTLSSQKLTLKFNICNNKKYRTLYAKGMKPYVFSHKLNQQKNIGWHQNGNNVVYKKYQNSYQFKQNNNGNKNYSNSNNNENDNGSNKQGENIMINGNSNITTQMSNSNNCVNNNTLNNNNNNNNSNNATTTNLNTPTPTTQPIPKQSNQPQQQLCYFSLSFQYQLQFQQDCIQFAYCPPYTYSQLKKDISRLKKRVNQQQNLQILQQRLCISLSGLQIPLLTITNNYHKQHNHNITDENQQQQSYNNIFPHNHINSINKKQQQNINNDQHKHKKVIFATARIHPGQSNGSHVMNGFLNFITSKQATYLRDKCIFKIVPMINPDGVILGNFRTGLAGKDLNRQFKVKNLQLLPEISSIKQYITKLKFEKGSSLLYYFDLHGHSTKKNSFVYGPEYDVWDTKFQRSKIFPKLVSFKTPMFKLNSCIYKVANYKKSTARAFLLGFVPFCYTVQSSIGIYMDQKGQNAKFTIEKWQQLGKRIGQGLQIAIDRLNEDNLKALLKKSKQKKNMILKQIDLQNTSKLSMSTNPTLRLQSSTKQLTPIPSQHLNREISSAHSIPSNIISSSLQLSQPSLQLSKKYLQPIKHFKHKQQIQLQFPQINQQIRQSDGQSDGRSDCQSQTNDFNKKQYQQISKQIMKVVKDFEKVIGFKDNICLTLNKKNSINYFGKNQKKDRQKLNSLCKKKNLKRKQSLSTSTKNGLIVKNNKNNNNNSEQMKLVPSLKYKLAKLINQGYITNKKGQKIKRNNSEKKIGGGLTAISFQRSFIGGR